MKYFVSAFVFSALLMHQANARAKEPFASLRQEVLEIIRDHYPDAKLTRNENLGCDEFKVKTRSFVIYRANKVGQWQKPFDTEAPDRGGLLVRLMVRKGRWSGALEIPFSHTHDLYVFKETHVIKDSSDGKSHIWAEILTPRFDSPDATRKHLVKLFNEFEKYE